MYSTEELQYRVIPDLALRFEQALLEQARDALVMSEEPIVQLGRFTDEFFAQELGTAEPVSAVKLQRALAALQDAPPSTREGPARVMRPIVAAPLKEKKSAPLKNLGALDRLFPR